jgi:hypothetical protein
VHEFTLSSSCWVIGVTMHRPHNRVSDSNVHLRLNTMNDVPYCAYNKDQSKSGWEVDIFKTKIVLMFNSIKPKHKVSKPEFVTYFK